MECKTFNELSHMEHGVCIFLGSGKTGKSTGLFSVAETFFPDREKYLVESYAFDNSIFPEYHIVSDVWDVPCGALCVIEDVPRVFPARKSQSQVKLGAFLSIISHKNIVCLASCQNSGSMDIDFMRTQRVLFFHKRVWDSDLDFERDEIKPFQVAANLALDHMVKLLPDENPKAFTYCSNHGEILLLGLPSWWGYSQSHFLQNAVPNFGGKNDC